MATSLYGFVDAAGAGYGSSVEMPQGKFGEPVLQGGTRICYGFWGRDMDRSSSSHRELDNLVVTDEEGVESGTLKDWELFVFTDNFMSECAFFNGNLDSRTLFDLMLQLWRAKLCRGLWLHVVHIARTRMIAQGTDGLSRGSLLERVMRGAPMLDFVPLAKSEFVRSPSCLAWVRSWWGRDMEKPLVPLTPEQWFVEGHSIRGGARDADVIWIPTSEEVGTCLYGANGLPPMGWLWGRWPRLGVSVRGWGTYSCALKS